MTLLHSPAIANVNARTGSLPLCKWPPQLLINVLLGGNIWQQQLPHLEDVKFVDEVVGDDLQSVLDEPHDDAKDPDPQRPQLVVALSQPLHRHVVQLPCRTGMQAFCIFSHF